MRLVLVLFAKILFIFEINGLEPSLPESARDNSALYFTISDSTIARRAVDVAGDDSTRHRANSRN
jgi:hypothetical protein